MCIADRAVEVSPQWNLDYVMPYPRMIIITVSCIMPYPTGQCINESLSERLRAQESKEQTVSCLISIRNNSLLVLQGEILLSGGCCC